ncbi:MAG: hypothetical protein NkDv07_0281 [Candidatus Improbicoccus devescovinae]|nr:MAG: hypothetical protein NkDv07_0281 [Candidatus Improbicoccus devescovinae]
MLNKKSITRILAIMFLVCVFIFKKSITRILAIMFLVCVFIFSYQGTIHIKASAPRSNPIGIDVHVSPLIIARCGIRLNVPANVVREEPPPAGWPFLDPTHNLSEVPIIWCHPIQTTSVVSHSFLGYCLNTNGRTIRDVAQRIEETLEPIEVLYGPLCVCIAAREPNGSILLPILDRSAGMPNASDHPCVLVAAEHGDTYMPPVWWWV